MRTHLITQIVLNQFADKDGKITVHFKDSDKTDKLTAYELAFTELDKQIMEHVEQQWSTEVENNAVKAINKLKDGGVLHEPKHISSLKKLMSLHFVRGNTLLQLMEIAKKKYAIQIIENVASVYPSHRKMLEKKVPKDWDKMVEESIPQIIEENRKKVDAYLEQFGLEIAQAPDDNKFVIGDIPALTMNESNVIGVPITECNHFVMPITPNHLVAVKSDPETKKYILLSTDQVTNANNKQIQRSLKEYYSI